MYFIILLVLSILLLKGKNKKVLPVLIVLYSLAFSTRSDSVPDTINYMDMYSGDYVGGVVEPGFLGACSLFRSIGLPFYMFLFSISVVCLSLWRKISKQVIDSKYILLAFIVYMSYMGIYYNGVVLRAYIAIVVVYVGIYYFIIQKKNYLLFCITCLLACLFHLSAFAFFIIPVLLNKKYSNLILLICICGSFALMLLNSSVGLITSILTGITSKLSAIAGDRFSNYLNNVETGVLSLNSIKYLLSGLMCIYVRDKISSEQITEEMNLFLNIYLFGICSYFLLNFIPSASRLAQLFLFFEFIPVTFLYYKAPGKIKWLVQSFVFVIIVTNYISLFRFIPQLYSY